MPTIRKTAQRLFSVALLTAGLNLATPANTALAMSQTPCTTGDLLHIWGHYSRPLIAGPSGPFEYCAANAGTMGLGAGAWVDKISTGNNDIQMNDANGTAIKISRWNIVTYPNRPPNITSIQIF